MKIGGSGIIGAAIGFYATKTVMGAIIGFIIGSLFNSTNGRNKRNTDPNFDFGKHLMMLSSIVMKADGISRKSELLYIKQFFTQQFGEEKSSYYIRELRTYLEKSISIEKLTAIIDKNINQSSKIHLLQYLIGIAVADGEMSNSEMAILKRISSSLGISEQVFLSVLAMFNFQKEGGGYHKQKNTNSNNGISLDTAYQILEISPNSSESEIKKAYRKLAIQYHPDKVAQLGEDFQKGAKEKFQKVQDSYETIKESRGIN